ncbi:SMI1/KNR4 family protein [Streptomyces acidicola]|uniref:Knr4/Smi1-like domain-containing protein n=1 Tax=Streptomyces acidicola TaxID=2596892 RepID=A0A5N8X0J3_9ACTN|nr:hypothetical protein [Streptomyces acidicola]MPY51965.1 hypothetical protein [Streptomyces acidicola]
MPIRSPENEAVAEAWDALTRWLAEHAPTSYASLLPPATDEEIATADSQLRQRLGFGLPVELGALWRLCGGVEHQDIEADEQGEIFSGEFLPDGLLLSPAKALAPRLPGPGTKDFWGAEVVPWLTGDDEDAPLQGSYVGAHGVGKWSLEDNPAGTPDYPSMAVYLERVHRTLTVGPANLMSSNVPGVVWGCLIWDRPGGSWLTDAAGHWSPVH